jgi:hypothetical protein
MKLKKTVETDAVATESTKWDDFVFPADPILLEKQAGSRKDHGEHLNKNPASNTEIF